MLMMQGGGGYHVVSIHPVLPIIIIYNIPSHTCNYEGMMWIFSCSDSCLPPLSTNYKLQVTKLMGIETITNLLLSSLWQNIFRWIFWGSRCKSMMVVKYFVHFCCRFFRVNLLLDAINFNCRTLILVELQAGAISVDEAINEFYTIVSLPFNIPPILTTLTAPGTFPGCLQIK